MARKRLRILALVAYPLDQAPGQRYRIEQWASYLEREDIDVVFRPFASQRLAESLYRPGHYVTKTLEMARCFVRRFRDVRSCGEFEAVYLHREASLIGPALLERLVKARNARLVYDFDDAVWLPYVSPRNRYLSYLKVPGKTAAICRMARAVIGGSEYLAAYARRYNDVVFVVPSTVDRAVYRPRPDGREREMPVIGWTGSHSSAQYLHIVERPLRSLAERYRFRFVVIGTEQVEIQGVDIETRPWRSETEVPDLWDLDIGIMPLPDDPWTRGKCAMKAIQYLGVGIPAVVSPVGANREAVRHGENGFWAASDGEWVTYLGRLLEDSDLRNRMGEAALATVDRDFSAEVQAPRVAAILKGVSE